MGPLGFRYIGSDGRTIRHAAELKRIRALAVPPAWTDVWICRDGRGHVQATGRDAKGRKQYRYHASWHACRGETKFDRMTAFAEALPAIRARTEADLAKMQDLLDTHREDLAGGRGPIMQASQFHLLVADAAKNQILADVVRPFFRLMLERGPQLYETTEGYAQWELEQHQRICDAIRSGDADAARLRMLEHVTSMGHHYEDAVEASQERTS